MNEYQREYLRKIREVVPFMKNHPYGKTPWKCRLGYHKRITLKDISAMRMNDTFVYVCRRCGEVGVVYTGSYYFGNEYAEYGYVNPKLYPMRKLSGKQKIKKHIKELLGSSIILTCLYLSINVVLGASRNPRMIVLYLTGKNTLGTHVLYWFTVCAIIVLLVEIGCIGLHFILDS